MKKRKALVVKIIIFVGLFFVAPLCLAGFFMLTYYNLTLPQINNFNDRPVPQTTKIYDKTGQVLLYDLYGNQKRTPIPFGDIPDSVKKSTLALEDKNFYSHSAFS